MRLNVTLCLLLTCAAIAHAEPSDEPSELMQAYFSAYSEKYRALRRTPVQKDGWFDAQVRALGTEFATARTREYEAIEVTRSLKHSCMKSSPGGATECEWKCVSAPNSDMYTDPEWVAFTGTDRSSSVIPSEACLKLAKPKKGKSDGSVTAVFRYSPKRIPRRVEAETAMLFTRIATTVKDVE